MLPALYLCGLRANSATLVGLVRVMDRSPGERILSPMGRPETRYAKSDDVNIAYQVTGGGDIDLVVVRGYVSNLEMSWETPGLARFYDRLGGFCRLILFDKRGTGVSDRVPPERLPTLEQRIDDVRAVMDAAQSDRAVIFGISEGGPMSVLFAATYPERTRSLILFGSFAKLRPEKSLARFFGGTVTAAADFFEKEWGQARDMPVFAPSVPANDASRAAWGRAQRMSASPKAAAALVRMQFSSDVRDILPAVRVPTLILHRSGDLAVDVSHGREMADLIPGAIYKELEGNDHNFYVGESDAIADEIEEFVTGVPVQRAAGSSMAETFGVIRRDGDFWTVGLGEEEAHVRQSKGLRYLQVLLKLPHRDVHVLELEAASSSAPLARKAGAHDLPRFAAPQPLLDDQAKIAYRKAIVELEAEITEAEEWNDPERAQRARSELEGITEHLSTSIGLRGRDRGWTDEAERARLRVSRSINRAIASVSGMAPRLGEHLSLTIKTGYFCSYRPDPRFPVRWDT